jgi:hypothetical protein
MDLTFFRAHWDLLICHMTCQYDVSASDTCGSIFTGCIPFPIERFALARNSAAINMGLELA